MLLWFPNSLLLPSPHLHQSPRDTFRRQTPPNRALKPVTSHSGLRGPLTTSVDPYRSTDLPMPPEGRDLHFTPFCTSTLPGCKYVLPFRSLTITKHFPHPLVTSTVQAVSLFELTGSEPSLKNMRVFIPHGLDGVCPAHVSRKYCPCDPENTGDTFAPRVPSLSRERFGAQPFALVTRNSTSLQPGLFKGKERKRWEGPVVFIMGVTSSSCSLYKTKVEILFLP